MTRHDGARTRFGGTKETSYGDRAPEGAGSVVYLAAPETGDRTYAGYIGELERLYVRLCDAMVEGDRVVVLAPYARLKRLQEVLPAESLREWTMGDLWLRDVAPILTPAGWVKCRYRPRQWPGRSSSPTEAEACRYVDRQCRRWLRSSGLAYRSLGLALDGGNLVHDGERRVVITERVLADNPGLTAEGLARLLAEETGLDRLCLLPADPDDRTGHADGMVVWLAPGVLGVGQDAEPLGEQVRRRLATAFPEVELVEVPCRAEDFEWRGYASATGVYVNSLETTAAVYVPVYGRRGDDEALEVFSRWSPRPVVPVRMGRVGRTGGSLRCLTWVRSAAMNVSAGADR